MKKNIISKMLFAGAAALLATSCIIDDPVAGPIIGGDTPGPDPGPGTEIFITPDGDFSDWDQIPASELATCVLPDDAFYPTGKKVMAYAGATFINLYVEYANQSDSPVQVMHLYIDSDNDQTTGMGSPAWTNDGADILFEGELFDEDGNFLGYDPTIFTFSGEPLSGEWEWTDAVAPGMGICNCSQPVELENGNMAFEMTIVRSAVPSLGSTFRMGVGLQYDWNDIAYLPAGSAIDNHGTREHGPAENLLLGASSDQPGPGPEPEVFITPDGDFSDWDQIPASELATCVLPDDAFYPTGKKVMAYGGATFVNLYVEYANQSDSPVQIMHLYIDSDNDQTTGMGNPAWTNDGADILFEGELFDEDGNFLGYDPTIFTFSGEPLSGEWEWTDAVAPGMDICNCSQPVELENGNMAFEMTIVRSAVPSLGSTFRMGVGLQYDWNDIAYLPAGSAIDNHGTREHGPAENLLLGTSAAASSASVRR